MAFTDTLLYELLGAYFASIVWLQSYLLMRRRALRAEAARDQAREGWDRACAGWNVSICRMTEAAGLDVATMEREALRMMSEESGNPKVNTKGGDA